MTLYNQIKADHLAARKAGDAALLSILTTLIGELQQSATAVEGGEKTVSDEAAQKVITKFVKNNNETLVLKPDATDLIAENLILNRYLPTKLSDDELAKIIHEFLSTAGDDQKGVGPVMKFLKESYGGQYDGKAAQQIIKDAL